MPLSLWLSWLGNIVMCVSEFNLFSSFSWMYDTSLWIDSDFELFLSQFINNYVSSIIFSSENPSK
jgi:hypothetical protein